MTNKQQEIASQFWPAPAKINLMLRIVGRRADGYHLLQTVFQFIELCDWIRFHPIKEDSVSLVKPLVGVNEADDLTVRAARLLKQKTDYPFGVKIEVDKHLPMGGGIGGGSSDAATTLVVLNHLWQLGLSQAELMSLGLSLGADVPIFVAGHAAWAEGVGEQLTAISPEEPWIVLLKPDCHVNTKEIFMTEELTRDSKSIRIADFTAGEQRNDCLAVVSKRYPEVRMAIDALSVFSPARLTGTGACVFSLFKTEQSALEAYHVLKEKHQVYLSRCVNKSPLIRKLES